MALFKKPDDQDAKKPADFSNVQSGSSSTAPRPAAPPPTPEPAPPAPHMYTVVSGDSLSRIAQREYGDSSQWRKIFEANRDQIKDPNLIHPGQSLRIP
jgi:nucleoid-associated protein YgaU